jgi:cellulose synthase/poly-beta-1,6-N-acetylglucosamine synthase-like glycosyltransferase
MSVSKFLTHSVKTLVTSIRRIGSLVLVAFRIKILPQLFYIATLTLTLITLGIVLHNLIEFVTFNCVLEFLNCILTLLITSVLAFRTYTHLGFDIAPGIIGRPPSYRDNHIAEDDLPPVTVQIASRNEPFNVTLMTLRSALAMDYPSDRLQIQIVDNSDPFNDDYLRLVDYIEGYNAWVTQGAKIELVHREGIKGFKAGNLNLGMRTATGEFILILDVDSTIPANTLRDSIQEFYRHPDAAFIQFSKEATNWQQSTLAKILWLRYTTYKYTAYLRSVVGMTFFWGQNGLWRRSALEAIGLWPTDLKAEDTEATVLSKLLGLRGIYCPHIRTGEWVPTTFSEYVKQQRNWVRAGTGVFYRYWKNILLSRHFRLNEKVDSLLELSNYLTSGLILALNFVPFFCGKSWLADSLIYGGLLGYLLGLFGHVAIGIKLPIRKSWVSHLPLILITHHAVYPYHAYFAFHFIFEELLRKRWRKPFQKPAVTVTDKGQMKKAATPSILFENRIVISLNVVYVLFALTLHWGLDLILFVPGLVTAISMIVAPFIFARTTTWRAASG